MPGEWVGWLDGSTIPFWLRITNIAHPLGLPTHYKRAAALMCLIFLIRMCDFIFVQKCYCSSIYLNGKKSYSTFDGQFGLSAFSFGASHLI